MKLTRIPGTNKKAEVVLYALSTCGWCKKTKKLLGDLSCEYFYIDVDLLPEAEQEQIQKEMVKWNPRVSFPTIVINNSTCIAGFDPEKIQEVLGP